MARTNTIIPQFLVVRSGLTQLKPMCCLLTFVLATLERKCGRVTDTCRHSVKSKVTASPPVRQHNPGPAEVVAPVKCSGSHEAVVAVPLFTVLRHTDETEYFHVPPSHHKDTSTVAGLPKN